MGEKYAKPGQKGTLVYRCRRCGADDKDTGVPDVLAAIVEITGRGVSPKEWGPLRSSMTSVHLCRDGSVGVSDLVGGDVDPR